MDKVFLNSAKKKLGYDNLSFSIVLKKINYEKKN